MQHKVAVDPSNLSKFTTPLYFHAFSPKYPPSLSRSRSRHGPVCVVAWYRNRRSQKEKKPSSPDSEAGAWQSWPEPRSWKKFNPGGAACCLATATSDLRALHLRFWALRPLSPVVGNTVPFVQPPPPYPARRWRKANRAPMLGYARSAWPTAVSWMWKNRYEPMVPSALAAQAILPSARRKGYPKQAPAWLPLSGAPN